MLTLKMNIFRFPNLFRAPRHSDFVGGRIRTKLGICSYFETYE
jgi:hypothetical protein